jgi:hypothetical protein
LKSPEGFADFEELLDLRVVDVEIAGGRAAAQRALLIARVSAVHHADERDDAAGLAVQADRLADAADIAPIGADAAAVRGEPDVLVPGVDDAFEAVVDRSGSTRSAGRARCRRSTAPASPA